MTALLLAAGAALALAGARFAAAGRDRAAGLCLLALVVVLPDLVGGVL